MLVKKLTLNVACTCFILRSRKICYCDLATLLQFYDQLQIIKKNLNKLNDIRNNLRLTFYFLEAFINVKRHIFIIIL